MTIKKYLLLGLLILTACKPKVQLVQTDLYFGLSKKDGSIISDSTATVFIDKNVGTVFKKGFTVIKTNGKWYDADAKVTYSEPSFIITSSDTMTTTLSAGIDSLRERYKRDFEQSSVLRVDKEVLSIN